MDTLVTITVVSDSKDNAEKAIDAAFTEIEILDKLLNFYSHDSEIANINNQAGISGVKVSADVFEVLNKTLYVSEMTEGAFDVTIGPVSMLYDFHKKIKPSEYGIKKNLPLVNYRYLVLDKDTSTVFLKKKGMLVDPGGITKGFAADKAVEVLKKRGIHSGIVSVAGDIKTFGLKPDGKPWKIGIRDARAVDKEDDVMGTIELKDMAISTSGDYERFFILDGQRYHHLLNPKTGYPALGCRSVSVITSEAVFTDAFSTGAFVLGPEKGLKLLERLEFEGVIVDNQGKIYVTAGLRGKIELKKSF